MVVGKGRVSSRAWWPLSGARRSPHGAPWWPCGAPVEPGSPSAEPGGCPMEPGSLSVSPRSPVFAPRSPAVPRRGAEPGGSPAEPAGVPAERGAAPGGVGVAVGPLAVAMAPASRGSPMRRLRQRRQPAPAILLRGQQCDTSRRAPPGNKHESSSAGRGGRGTPVSTCGCSARPPSCHFDKGGGRAGGGGARLGGAARPLSGSGAGFCVVKARFLRSVAARRESR